MPTGSSPPPIRQLAARAFKIQAHQPSGSWPHAISPELKPLIESSPGSQCTFVTIESSTLQRTTCRASSSESGPVRKASLHLQLSLRNLRACGGRGMERLVLLLQNGFFRVRSPV